MDKKKNVNNNQEQGVKISALSQIWIGFVLAGFFLVADILEQVQGDSGLMTFIIGYSAFIYWLFCIYQIHKILGQVSPTKYPISPRAAAGFHLLPFYNLYWVFKWPTEFSNFINQQGSVKMASGKKLGIYLLLGLIIRIIDGTIGLVILFLILNYMAKKLRKQLEHSK